MKVAEILKSAGYPTNRANPAVFAAAVAAAREELDEMNLHHLVSPEGFAACVYGCKMFDPSRTNSDLKNRIDAGWQWKSVSNRSLEEMANQMVINAITDHWRMENADSVAEAMGA